MINNCNSSWLWTDLSHLSQHLYHVVCTRFHEYVSVLDHWIEPEITLLTPFFDALREYVLGLAYSEGISNSFSQQEHGHITNDSLDIALQGTVVPVQKGRHECIRSQLGLCECFVSRVKNFRSYFELSHRRLDGTIDKHFESVFVVQNDVSEVLGVCAHVETCIFAFPEETKPTRSIAALNHSRCLDEHGQVRWDLHEDWLWLHSLKEVIDIACMDHSSLSNS